jgi:hypothetical protein
MKVVRLSALGTGCPYLQEIPLVLISVRRLSRPKVTVQPKGFIQWKILTSSGIEPVTYRLVAQCLKELRRRVSLYRLGTANYSTTIITQALWIRSYYLGTITCKFVAWNMKLVRYRHVCNQLIAYNTPSINCKCSGGQIYDVHKVDLYFRSSLLTPAGTYIS